MTEALPEQVDAFVTPGAMLRQAREARGIDERDMADRLNWMPGYVAMVEQDDYQSLRRPAFARGYVRAYGKQMGLDEEDLLTAFDHLQGIRGAEQGGKQRKISTRPLQLQQTGRGVVVGLFVLVLFTLALWVQRGKDEPAAGSLGSPASFDTHESAPISSGGGHADEH